MKKLTILICMLVCILCMTACGESQVDSENQHAVYYLSNSETKLEMHEYSVQGETTDEQTQELLLVLQTSPASLKYKAPMSMGYQLLNYELKSGRLLLNMSKEYHSLTNTQEVLVRAAIVKTMTQVRGVNFVMIMVEGEQLTDSQGKGIGWENSDQFVENEGNEINPYETVELTLYFTDETGTGLMSSIRTIEYSSNISKEKLIVEELIKGPKAANTYPTINAQTKVSSVTVQDGVCYVNLDEKFLTPVPNVTPEVTIYSITNSLVELPNINKVQISINGDSTGTFRDKFSLETYYERNLNLIINDE